MEVTCCGPAVSSKLAFKFSLLLSLPSSEELVTAPPLWVFISGNSLPCFLSPSHIS